MTTKAKKKNPQRQRPEKSLDQFLLEEGIDPSKRSSKSLIDKQFTAIKAPGDEGGEFGGVFTPDDDQLAKINQFTLQEKSADEVLCFSTLSCNDMLDRDLDRFTTDCVNDFAKLEGALSPVGKSFMVSHDYTKLPVGRIFDVDTKTIDGTRFLTNDVYMPNTEQYKDFAENLDFGIYWAVSVGVMLEESKCSICDSEMYAGRFFSFCYDEGHEKGLWYDPDSDEKDSWGWAEPVNEDTKGAVLCTRDLSKPKDFYELSQCFLGAQYDAALQRGAMKGVVKAASAGSMPILNLSKKEAKSLPITHAPDKVRDAYAKGYEVELDDDGGLTWSDDNDLIWQFTPGEDEVLCLGEKQSSEDDEQEVNDDGTEDGIEPEVTDDQDASGSDDSLGDEDEDGLSDEDELLGDDEKSSADPQGVGNDSGIKASSEEGDDDDEDDGEADDEDDEEDSSTDDDDTSSSDDAKMPKGKQAVLRAARKAKLPDSTLKLIRDADGNGLDELMGEVAKVSKRASLGDEFIKAKQDEALKWYVRARQSGQEKGVNTERFERMMKHFGDDIEMIEEVIEEHKELAQAKFPASVRRSTVERDPENIEELEEVAMSKNAADKVRRVHG